MPTKEHWENVYSSKAVDKVSWYQPHATVSLELIRNAGVPPSASIIDVGAGASTFVDDLLSHGYEHITVLDLSAAALETAKTRLGHAASRVNWIEGNVINIQRPTQGYDVWHDRAVFHFLTEEADRRAYVDAVLRVVKPGGLVIVATFAEDGPTQCSGLPVMRYAPDQLHDEFGEPFLLLGHEKELHVTPGGNTQKFVYCFCKKLTS